MRKTFIHFAIILQLFVILTLSYAQDNYGAGCAIDLNIYTHNFDMDISNKDIGTKFENTDNNIVIGIVAQNVLNLKTFQVEINYPTEKLKFINGYEDIIDYINPENSINNLLKKYGGTTFWSVQRTIKWEL